MKRLTVIYSPQTQASSFVVEGLNREDVDIIPLYHRRAKFCKMMYHICLILHLYYVGGLFHFQKETIQRLRKVQNDMLYFDCCRLYEYMVLVKLTRKYKKHLFFWNPLALSYSEPTKVKKHVEILRHKDVILYTFDPKDADFYHLQLVKNVNRKMVFPLGLKLELKYDFYFVGLPKSRENFLKSLESTLKDKGYKTKFIVVESRKDYISMVENLRNSSQSSCIVDIVSDKYKQSGLTLRPFDALFLHKKLITNCPAIVNSDFYHPDNIFIINENMNGIEEFMLKPYYNISDSIVNQYEINNWIEQFIDK